MMMPFDSNNPNQQWRFEDGYIVNHNRKDEVLDVIAAKNTDGAELCSYERHGGTNQQWSRSFVWLNCFTVCSAAVDEAIWAVKQTIVWLAKKWICLGGDSI